MPVNWTDEQLKAINAEGSNILVAAAAGSGKTAVLVERIIRKICDTDHPVPVDRLLVLTFTEAAASEMKRKISEAIYERLRQEPENKWLREQSMLIHSAHISTVHAFCKSVLQNNIHETVLPVDFSLIDDTENEVLRNNALEQVLDRYYKRIDKKHAFRDLTVGYGGIKSDDSLRSTVLKLHDFMRSLAYPRRWISEAADAYRRVCSLGTLKGTIWERILLEVCSDLAIDVLEGYRAIWNIVEQEVPSEHPFFTYYRELPLRFEAAYARILSKEADIDEARRCQEAFKKGQARGKKDLDEDLVKRIDKARSELVNIPLKEIKVLLEAAEPERIQRIIGCSPRVCVLKQLVRQTERLHKSMKRERSALDFSDLEHETINLISDGRGNPTKIAKRLQERFEEILVDEYQDTNNIQDTMFRLLSRDEKNIFMVGDLKQSIYKFRNADPGIFAGKYERYSRGDGGICIRLFKNFRSRKEVVDSINGLFDSLMTGKLGGLDYTKEEYLIQGAEYRSDAGDFSTEVLVTDTNMENYRECSQYIDMPDSRMEALTVVRRITNLVQNREMCVTDKKTGELRPVRFGDITILVRTNSSASELTKVMEENNIPFISESGRKYLDSLEVMTVLNFLQIIDNPRQDIPLLAVMRSAMFNFSPDELAEIRLCAEGDFYNAVSAAAENGNKKAEEFLSILSELRKDAVYMGVDELIWKICNDLYYMALVGAMPGGSIRQANLKLLYERGAEFEQGTLSGLFNFMGYIESLRGGGKDMVAAKPFSDEADTVNVMTIHKSKGLEYPVVILFGMQKYFNETDESRPVIWNENIGIAMDYVDTIQRVRYLGLSKLLVKDRNISELRSEEMRLLYVALTRAKEKLILSCTSGQTRNKWKEAVFDENKRVVPGFARRRTSMRDWVLSALLAHPEAGELREFADRIDIMPNSDMNFKIYTRVINLENEPEEEAKETERTGTEKEAPTVLYPSVKERVEYEYPHRNLSLTPVKLSVSEIKRRQMPEEDFVPGIVKINNVVLTDNSEIGASEIGTITHYVIQHINFAETETLEQIKAQMKKMVQSGLISSRQHDAVDAEKIFGFFKHSLGKRLVHAQRAEREFDFYMEIPAGEIIPELTDGDRDEKILLQGIADCFFYDGDGIVLIDYKTDRVSALKAPERAERYRIQIDCYTRGLESILKLPIKERYLYFLHCRTAVEV